jgi:hypothetical protein
VVPAKRNFLAAAWGSFVALLTAIWNAISDSIGQAWDFLHPSQGCAAVDR